jgi:hypothetical protein
MRDRFYNAYHIWQYGACNPAGVARSLVEAIDESRAAHIDPSEDIACKMILDHLAFLLGVPQPSCSSIELGMDIAHWCNHYEPTKSSP